MRRRHRLLVAALVCGGMATACGSTLPPSELARTQGGTTGLGSSVDAPQQGLGGSAVLGPQGGSAPGAGSSAYDPAAAGTAPSSPAGPSSGPAAPTRTALPAAGFGWDASTVYIGVTEASDQAAALDSAGFQGVNPGNQEVQSRAMATYLNKRGGLFGRKVVIRFDDHRAASLSSQPEVEAQATCDRFSRDQPVVAVVNTQTALDTPSLHRCLLKAGIPLFGVSITAVDDAVITEARGLFTPTIVPTWNRFAPVFVPRLQALGYFTGWDSSGGRPGAAPAKIGVLAHDDPVTKRVVALLRSRLAAAGHAPAAEYFHTDITSEASSAVLQFRGRGVTHVINVDGGAQLLVFAVAAESQTFRPRYGLWTGNGPGVAFELNVPKAQLAGAVGVGSSPPLDVVKTSGELAPGGALCRRIMRDGGETYQGKRFAEAFAFSICDAIRVYADAALAGGALRGEGYLRGLSAVGARFQPGTTFLSGVTGAYPVLPGAGRDLRFEQGCSCFQYVGPARRF